MTDVPTICLDKSQVFALRLNREEFAKKSRRSILRKFLIDAGASRDGLPIHHFETIQASLAETCRSPSALIGCL
jgi:hypothetical protein